MSFFGQNFDLSKVAMIHMKTLTKIGYKPNMKVDF